MNNKITHVSNNSMSGNDDDNSSTLVIDDLMYEQILKRFNELRSQRSVLELRHVISQLKQEFCGSNNFVLSDAALCSLIGGAFQQEQKWRHRAANWPLIVEEHRNGQPLLGLSASAQLSPRLVAQKLITERLGDRVPPDQVKNALADSNQIDDGRLAFEAMLANYCDPMYGTHSAHVAANAGSRFEQQVADGLRSLNAHFAPEQDLRPAYDVTPDFKLTVPLVLIRSNDSTKSTAADHESANDQSSNDDFRTARIVVHNFDAHQPVSSGGGFEGTTAYGQGIGDQCDLINWIECKALFANADVHEEHTRNQLDAYGNRFGKGLVLYQHGCVRSLLRPNAHFIVWPGQPQFVRVDPLSSTEQH